jgi:hypothetical protein
MGLTSLFSMTTPYYSLQLTSTKHLLCFVLHVFCRILLIYW